MGTLSERGIKPALFVFLQKTNKAGFICFLAENKSRLAAKFAAGKCVGGSDNPAGLTHTKKKDDLILGENT